MTEPTEEQLRQTEHVRKLKAALDKARENGEPLNLTIGKHKAVYEKGKLKLNSRKKK